MKNCHLMGAARRGVGIMNVIYQGRAGWGAQGWLLLGRDKVPPRGWRAWQGQERQEVSVAAKVGRSRSHRAWKWHWDFSHYSEIWRPKESTEGFRESVEQEKEKVWERNVATLGGYLGRSSLDTGFILIKWKINDLCLHGPGTQNALFAT